MIFSNFKKTDIVRYIRSLQLNYLSCNIDDFSSNSKKSEASSSSWFSSVASEVLKLWIFKVENKFLSKRIKWTRIFLEPL